MGSRKSGNTLSGWVLPSCDAHPAPSCEKTYGQGSAIIRDEQIQRRDGGGVGVSTKRRVKRRLGEHLTHIGGG